MGIPVNKGLRLLITFLFSDPLEWIVNTNVSDKINLVVSIIISILD